MQTLAKQFCRGQLSSEQPTALKQLGHLHCWETGKLAARGPWDRGKTVRNDGMSHERTRDVSARSRWNLLTVGIGLESAAWVAVLACVAVWSSHCPARHSRLSPLPRTWLETSLVMDKWTFHKCLSLKCTLHSCPQKMFGSLSLMH